MPRTTGVFKRRPEMTPDLSDQYAKISKADWADLYFDLYRQTHAETDLDEEIMDDVQKRLAILKQHRSQSA